MRKQDYATLAEALKNEIRSSDTWLINPAGVGDENISIANARRNVAERLASHLAQNLAVDRVAFLTACDLKP